MRAQAGILLCCVAATAMAAEGMVQAFDPRPTPPDVAWRAGGETRWYGTAQDRDSMGGGGLAVDREQASLSWLGLRREADEGWLDLRAARTALVGDLRLPGSGDPSGEYLDLGIGATWKRLLGGGDVVGASVSTRVDGELGSDDLQWGGEASVFGRIGLGEEGRDGLLLALNYDPDRVVLPGVPVLPFAAWQGLRGRWFLLLGVPFTVVTYRGEAWSSTAVLGPTPALSADVRLSGPLRAVGEVRWSVLQVRRAQRPRNDDRLRLSQWEWSGGLRLGFGPAMRYDLVGGAATARRLGEDVDSGDARRDGVSLEPAPFIALRGRLQF